MCFPASFRCRRGGTDLPGPPGGCLEHAAGWPSSRGQEPGCSPATLLAGVKGISPAVMAPLAPTGTASSVTFITHTCVPRKVPGTCSALQELTQSVQKGLMPESYERWRPTHGPPRQGAFGQIRPAIPLPSAPLPTGSCRGSLCWLLGFSKKFQDPFLHPSPNCPSTISPSPCHWPPGAMLNLHGLLEPHECPGGQPPSTVA